MMWNDSRLRRFNWVKPSGYLNGRINSFSPRYSTSSDTRKIILFWYIGINKLLTDRGDDKKWETMSQASLDIPIAIIF